jgi:hypothetical protein
MSTMGRTRFTTILCESTEWIASTLLMDATHNDATGDIGQTDGVWTDVTPSWEGRSAA